MLDDVQCRPLLEQPPRETTPPCPVGAAHVHLHERARQLLGLPRRGPVTGAQADDHVTDPCHATGAKTHFAAGTVTLVEYTDHGDAFRHRRRAGDRRAGTAGVDRLYAGRRPLRHILFDPDRRDRRIGRGQRAITEPATDRERHDQHGRSNPADHPSGVQAS
ncbi:hypothetical protein GCM10022268_21780 [Sphingomonas cynarae]|uniref:Uncharacterized protein n=1 Tax=Sphingomonas cynarae TaxID=930197 RepID=A0ABP7E1Z1_9SPHN